MTDSSKQVIIEFNNLSTESLLLDDDPISTLNKIRDFENKIIFSPNHLIKLFIKKGIFEFSEMINYFKRNLYNLDDNMVDALKAAYVTTALNTTKLTSSLNDVRDYKYEQNPSLINKLESSKIIDEKNGEGKKEKIIIDPDEFKVMRQSIKIHLQEKKRGYYLQLRRNKELASHLDKQANYYCEKILSYEKLYNLNSIEAKEIVLAEMLGIS